MVISEIHINRQDHPRLLALVSVVFDNAFVVRGLKLVLNRGRPHLAMPVRRKAGGGFRDLLTCIDRKFRQVLEAEVVRAYLEDPGGLEAVGVAACVPTGPTPAHARAARELPGEFRFCHFPPDVISSASAPMP